MRIALFQANTGIDPQRNADALVRRIGEAGAAGAAMLFTPVRGRGRAARSSPA